MSTATQEEEEGTSVREMGAGPHRSSPSRSQVSTVGGGITTTELCPISHLRLDATSLPSRLSK